MPRTGVLLHFAPAGACRRCSEIPYHGSLRIGIYRRRLRSPLLLTGFGNPDLPEIGILTGSATSPLVSVIGGTVTADEMLRIQAVFDIRNSVLLLSLIGMTEDGPAENISVRILYF